MYRKTDDPDDPRHAEKTALGLLARREHSRYELLAKLRQRGFERACIEDVLDRLIEQGWQSDARYAESYLRMRVDRGYGLAAIEAELRQRGVEAPLIWRAVAEAEVDWVSCARKQVYRHFNRSPENAAEQLRRYRHLMNRGFAPEEARAVSAWWPDDPDAAV